MSWLPKVSKQAGSGKISTNDSMSYVYNADTQTIIAQPHRSEEIEIEHRQLDSSVTEVLDPTKEIDLLTAAGSSDAVSLSDSTDIPIGFVKTIVMEAQNSASDTIVISPYTVPASAYTVTLSSVGASVQLMYVKSIGWIVVSKGENATVNDGSQWV